ncbi:uncharacterized protein LOC111698048 [Eurytemora carolleeae]|uniref:uncharacterized protein LOC111698048 n=1 Tax=Eurytemora carolleeae TaxID=1294199 RepID=UPI000C771E76|nr:uncharacterized protein LOC111698048 [Eurytemora carolleeae]XP_023324042.1 uncharacterized protein LOC111698048 [Eurytemora carolleeae]|eukprot:XP_023324040.1 uncharacterized protein LOC111698048 [Eurytemora affinis]
MKSENVFSEESEEEWIYESDSVTNIEEEEEDEARQNANIDPTSEVTYNPLQQFDEYFNNEAEDVFSEESKEEWMDESDSVIQIEKEEEDEADLDQITDETYSSAQCFDYEFNTKAYNLESSMEFIDQTGTMKVCMQIRESQLLEKIYQLTVENHKFTVENHKLTVENHKLTVANHKLTVANHKLTVENNNLTDANHKLTVANHKLTVENNNLTDANHNLTNANHNLTDAIMQLSVEII